MSLTISHSSEKVITHFRYTPFPIAKDKRVTNRDYFHKFSPFSARDGHHVSPPFIERPLNTSRYPTPRELEKKVMI